MLNKYLYAPLALLLLAPVIPASAQNAPGGPGAGPQVPVPCAPRTAVMDELKQTFDEQPAGRGVAGDGTVLELLISPAGTWTLLVSLPNGHSCFATAGEGWENVDGSPQPKATGGAKSKSERLISFRPR